LRKKTGVIYRSSSTVRSDFWRQVTIYVQMSCGQRRRADIYRFKYSVYYEQLYNSPWLWYHRNHQWRYRDFQSYLST